MSLLLLMLADSSVVLHQSDAALRRLRGQHRTEKDFLMALMTAVAWQMPHDPVFKLMWTMGSRLKQECHSRLQEITHVADYLVGP